MVRREHHRHQPVFYGQRFQLLDHVKAGHIRQTGIEKQEFIRGALFACATDLVDCGSAVVGFGDQSSLGGERLAKD